MWENIPRCWLLVIFKITSCLDIHAQKTELFHAFENSLFPSNSNMRGNFFKKYIYIKASHIYGFTDNSQSPWSHGFAFLDFRTVVSHAWIFASQKALEKGRGKDLLPLLTDKIHGKSERVPHKGHIDVHKDRQLILTTTLNVVSRPATDFPC